MKHIVEEDKKYLLALKAKYSALGDYKASVRRKYMSLIFKQCLLLFIICITVSMILTPFDFIQIYNFESWSSAQVLSILVSFLIPEIWMLISSIRKYEFSGDIVNKSYPPNTKFYYINGVPCSEFEMVLTEYENTTIRNVKNEFYQLKEKGA